MKISASVSSMLSSTFNPSQIKKYKVLNKSEKLKELTISYILKEESSFPDSGRTVARERESVCVFKGPKHFLKEPAKNHPFATDS
jgi:hypothetical protein